MDACIDGCTHVKCFLSSRLFKSLEILYPVAFTRFPCRHFNVHIDSRALRFITLPHLASLPSNQTFLKPFSVVYNATTPFPPHSLYLTPPQPATGPSPTLTQNAPSTTHPSPIACPKHFRRPQGPRESSQSTTTHLPPIHRHIQEAVRIGGLPLVTRRLTDQERSYWIRSGSIFVWKESDDDTGIKRWTDGICWSQSRMREPFLFYEEKQTDDRRVTNPKINIPCDAYVPATPFRLTGSALTLVTGAAPPPPARASPRVQILLSTCHTHTLQMHCRPSSKRRPTLAHLSSKRTPPGSPTQKPIRGASTI